MRYRGPLGPFPGVPLQELSDLSLGRIFYDLAEQRARRGSIENHPRCAWVSSGSVFRGMFVILDPLACPHGEGRLDHLL